MKMNAFASYLDCVFDCDYLLRVWREIVATLVLALQHISPEMLRDNCPCRIHQNLGHIQTFNNAIKCVSNVIMNDSYFFFELYLLLLFLLDITLTLFSHMVHNANNIELTLIK